MNFQLDTKCIVSCYMYHPNHFGHATEIQIIYDLSAVCTWTENIHLVWNDFNRPEKNLIRSRFMQIQDWSIPEFALLSIWSRHESFFLHSTLRGKFLGSEGKNIPMASCSFVDHWKLISFCLLFIEVNWLRLHSRVWCQQCSWSKKILSYYFLSLCYWSSMHVVKFSWIDTFTNSQMLM